MQNEILLVADAVSGEKGLPKSSIFEAIEMALATATKRRYEENSNIEVKIDSVTGEYETFRLWTIVASVFWIGNSIYIAIFGYLG